MLMAKTASRARTLQPVDLFRGPRLLFHLPAHVVEDVRRRLGFGILGIGFAILASSAWMLTVSLTGLGECPPFHFYIYGAGAVSAVVIYRLSQKEEISSALLVNMGLAYEALVALCTSILEKTTPLGHGSIEGLSWVTVLIVFFPVVVPTTPGKTLFAGLAVTLASVVGNWLVTADIDHLLLWNNLVATGLSIVPALVVSHLGEQLNETRALGQYLLEEKLGQGAMGEVWRGSHRQLMRPAAIKLIRPDFFPNEEEGWEQLRREARITAKLTSPHTVTVYDFGITEKNEFFCVMELLEGLDLERRVLRDGPFEPGKAIQILLQLCLSLAEAHGRGLVHRDIKPANIFLCQAGTVTDFVKVLDFGLAVGYEEHLLSGAQPKAGGKIEQTRVFGTPSFVAPEQARGEPIDGRADLYALGGVAYWLLTGETVFPNCEREAAILSQLNEVPPPLATRLGSFRISPRFEALIDACLRKEPSKRPGSAEELWRHLSYCPEAVGQNLTS